MALLLQGEHVVEKPLVFISFSGTSYSLGLQQRPLFPQQFSISGDSVLSFGQG